MHARNSQSQSDSLLVKGILCGLLCFALCMANGCSPSGAQLRAMSRASHQIEAGYNPDRTLAKAFGLDEFGPESTAVANAQSDRP